MNMGKITNISPTEPTPTELAEGIGRLFSMISTLHQSKISLPTQQEIDRGKAIKKRARKGGLVFSDIENEPLFAGLIGLFGAIERLQKKVATYEANHKIKGASVAELPKVDDEESKPLSE